MKEDGQYSQGQLIDHLRMESSLWKARAENAEAELESIRKGAGKEIERWNILNNENFELKAEVERLRDAGARLIKHGTYSPSQIHEFKWRDAVRDFWKAQKEGPNDA
jgi:hypothetical protein